MLEPNRIPQPLLAAPESMNWPERQYFRAYPSVFSYANAFKEFDSFKDLSSARTYLALHNQTQGTYGNYRGIVERLLLWSWIYAGKSVLSLTHRDIADFLEFNKTPPSDWVGNAPKSRFIDDSGYWVSNPEWRPLLGAKHIGDQTIDSDFKLTTYQPHKGTLRQILSICSSFYNFLHREGLAPANPIAGAKPEQGRAFLRGQPPRNLISPPLIELIIQQLERQALDSPDGERVLFVVAAALYLYLQASDLACADNTLPTMDSFVFDEDSWWFVHSNRSIPYRSPVNPDFLPYLVRYRTSRGLSPLPEPNEGVPLLETTYGRPGVSIRRINELVKASLIVAYRSLLSKGHNQLDLEIIKSISLRWFRDSGAKFNALNLSPADLGRCLGNVSPAYVYARYYVD